MHHLQFYMHCTWKISLINRTQWKISKMTDSKYFTTNKKGRWHLPSHQARCLASRCSMTGCYALCFQVKYLSWEESSTQTRRIGSERLLRKWSLAWLLGKMSGKFMISPKEPLCFIHFESLVFPLNLYIRYSWHVKSLEHWMFIHNVIYLIALIYTASCVVMNLGEFSYSYAYWIYNCWSWAVQDFPG